MAEKSFSVKEIQIQGSGTGLINLEIIDQTAIQDQNDYKIIFSEDDGLNYSVYDEQEVFDEFFGN